MEIRYRSPLDHHRLNQESCAADDVVSAALRVKRELDPLLEAPFGMDVLNDAGDRVTIAFDDREGFMMFDPAGEIGEIEYTLGDLARTDYKAFLCSQWTEMSGKYMIPTKLLLSAFSEWAASGKLSPQVKWTVDIY
jgi:hypothetical protein